MFQCLSNTENGVVQCIFRFEYNYDRSEYAAILHSTQYAVNARFTLEFDWTKT